MGEAARRIQADKRKYLPYFIDDHRDEPGVAALTMDDLRPSRLVVVEPTPIPEEARRTIACMRSWGVLGNIGYQEFV